MMPEVIRVEHVVKDIRPGFGLVRRRVLDDVSLEVRQGEIFGFVGPNGAGKTTTLKLLVGLIRATSGRASILGHAVGTVESRRHIGFLPENPYFYDYLSGREILDFYARLSGVPASGRKVRVAELLESVGLARSADNRLRSYSKGMLQRVGIAQALIHDPDVLFLDEPMSGLDPVGRKEVRDLILQLRDAGKTVFMNTHILSDVEMLCDRVAIIVAGRIRHIGQIQGFIDSSRHGGDSGRVCDVVLSNLSPELAVRLEEGFGQELRGLSERVELRVSDKDVDSLLQIALQAGGRVVSVTPHHASLEEIFLQAVRVGSDEEPSA